MLAAVAPELQRGAGSWHAEWPALTALLKYVGGAASRLRTSLSGLQVDEAAMQRLANSVFGEYGGGLDPNVGVAYDRVPRGEVELRNSSGVFTADEHHVGRVRGVVVDPTARIAAVLLERGHLWWRREIQVPAALLSGIGNDTVTLRAPKSELDSLPSARI